MQAILLFRLEKFKDPALPLYHGSVGSHALLKACGKITGRRDPPLVDVTEEGKW
jgi:hypothetical protein